MVGYNNIITFNINGKVTDYQKAYNNNYAKILDVYLPPNFGINKQYQAELSIATSNTYPKQIVNVCGIKSDTDLNKYSFDLSEVYRLNYEAQNKKPGLCRFKLYTSNGRVRFESESFRI